MGKTDKGCPKGAVNTPRLFAGHLSAIALARFLVSTSGMPITMFIAVSIAISIAIIIITLVPLARYAIVPRSVSVSLVSALETIVSLIVI